MGPGHITAKPVSERLTFEELYKMRQSLATERFLLGMGRRTW